MLRNKAFWVYVLVGGVILGRVVLNGFVGDDSGYISHPYIQQFRFTGLMTGSSSDLGGTSPVTGNFYRPLMLVCFGLIYMIFGQSAWVYHLFQLGLFIGNAYLVFLLLKKFTSEQVAGLLGLVFLVHPINIETLAYVSNLQDTLFVFFGLLAVNILIKQKITRANMVWIGVFLFLSLLAKETGLLFVAVGLTYLFFFPKKQKLFPSITLTSTALFYLIIRLGPAKVGFGQIPLAPIGQLTLAERLMQMPYLVFYYFKTLLWPVNLALGQTWIAQNNPISECIFFIASGILLCLIGYLTKISKEFIFFGTWLVLGLAMHLQILPLEMTVADRWFYFPFIGLLGLVAIILKFISKPGLVLCLGIIILFAARSFVRLGDWKNAETLYEHDTGVTESYLLEHALGYELMQRGNAKGAFGHLNKSVTMYQTPFNTNSLGVYYYQSNDIPEAMSWFKRSMEIGDYYLAYQNYARLGVTNLPTDESIEFLKLATRKFPKSDLMQFLLTIAEYKKQNYDNALTAARKAYLLSPTQQNAYVLNQLQNGQPIKFLDE